MSRLEAHIGRDMPIDDEARIFLAWQMAMGVVAEYGKSACRNASNDKA